MFNVIKVNRENINCHYDNTKTTHFLQSRQKLLQSGWNVLPHPPYLPNMIQLFTCLGFAYLINPKVLF